MWVTLVFHAVCYCQVRVSVVGGPSFSTFVGPEVVAWGQVLDDPAPAPRFHAGISLGWTLNDYFSIEPGLLYGTKGASYKGERTYYNQTSQRSETGTIAYRKNLGYVQLPVTGKFRLSTKFCLQTGPKISVLAAAKVKNDASDAMLTALQLKKTEKDKGDYKTVDLGWVFGVVYEFTSKLSTQVSFDAGLNKIGKTKLVGEYPNPATTGKSYSAGIRNNVAQISLSYRIKG